MSDLIFIVLPLAEQCSTREAYSICLQISATLINASCKIIVSHTHIQTYVRLNIHKHALIITTVFSITWWLKVLRYFSYNAALYNCTFIIITVIYS